MRLYSKTILIISLTFFAVFTLLLIGFELTVLDSYASLEYRYADLDLERAENAFNDQITRIEEIAADYAIWDDSYTYVVDLRSSFVEKNLIQSTTESLGISGIYFFGKDGTYLSGVTDDTLLPRNEIDLIQLFKELELNNTRDAVSGIISYHDLPVLIATHPILTSNRGGPPKGMVIVADIIDESHIKELSEQLIQNINIQPFSSEKYALLTTNRTSLSGSLTHKDTLSLTKIFSDIRGNPAFILTIEEPLDFWEQGLYSRDFLLLALIVLMLCFLGVSITLINLVVISPLRELHTHLLSIGDSGSLSGRIPTGRTDEIGDIALTINTMLSQLERIEKKRFTSEQRFKNLVEVAEEGICVINKEGIIRFANQKVSEIWKISPETLQGMNLGYLLIPDEHWEGVEVVSQIQHDTEFKTRTPDGIELFLKVTTTDFLLESGEDGYLCIITDVSGIRKTMQALELSNKKLSLLGSMTRHDIVNQLTTIRGMITLAKAKNQDEKVAPLLNAATEASEKIHKHIEFSKEYQKAGIEAPSWQNLHSVWHLAWAMARKKGVTFIIEGNNYEIYADALLQKVFYNLIDNSLKHGVGVFNITIRTMMDDDSLCVFYEDDGEGIPNDRKEKVFERGVGTGTGWGLFFVREILALSNISITETGTYGIGVIFEIRIPSSGYRPLTEPSLYEETREV